MEGILAELSSQSIAVGVFLSLFFLSFLWTTSFYSVREAGGLVRERGKSIGRTADDELHHALVGIGTAGEKLVGKEQVDAKWRRQRPSSSLFDE